MKKVAVCISGHVRGFEDNYSNFLESIININPLYSFDTFIHTWDTRNSVNTEIYRRPDEGRAYRNNFNTYDYTNLLKIYAPKSICIEQTPINTFLKTKKYNDLGLGPNNAISVFSQFFKVKKCKDLLISYCLYNNTTYDLIIRTRFDIQIKPIKLDNFNIQENLLYVETDGCDTNWISDKFCITTFNTYNVYSSFYNNLENLIQQHNTIIPERLLFEYINSHNIQIIKTDEIGRLKLY